MLPIFHLRRNAYILYQLFCGHLQINYHQTKNLKGFYIVCNSETPFHCFLFSNTKLFPKFWPLGSLWRLSSERIPLHYSITCKSECLWSAFCVRLVGRCWFAFVFISSFTCCFFTFYTGFLFICISLGERKHLMYKLWNQAIIHLLCFVWCSFKGRVWWLLLSLVGQLFFILLLYYTFLKRPLGIYSTIKSIFLWCNLSLPYLFCAWVSAECFIKFLL